MIDLKTVEFELRSARRARINVELSCCEIEELAEAIRRSHIVWTQQLMTRNPTPGRHMH